jgi:hypothetical protein
MSLEPLVCEVLRHLPRPDTPSVPDGGENPTTTHLNNGNLQLKTALPPPPPPPSAAAPVSLEPSHSSPDLSCSATSLSPRNPSSPALFSLPSSARARSIFPSSPPPPLNLFFDKEAIAILQHHRLCVGDGSGSGSDYTALRELIFLYTTHPAVVLSLLRDELGTVGGGGGGRGERAVG